MYLHSVLCVVKTLVVPLDLAVCRRMEKPILCKCKLSVIYHTQGNGRKALASSIATHQLLGFALIFSNEDITSRLAAVIGITAS